MSRRTALVVVFLALAARLALLALVHHRDPMAFSYVDTEDYLGPARALRDLGAYAPGPERPGEAEIVRAPGYPLLMAATFTLLGEERWALSAVGALLATATALVLLFGMGRFVGERASAWGATLLCLDAGSVARSLDLLSETLFTLLLALALLALCSAVSRGPVRPAPALLAGFLTGAAVLVRPILLYFPLAAAAGLAWVAVRRAAGTKARLLPVAAFLAPVTLLAGGWIVRNGVATGAYVMTPVAGHQLLHRRAAAVDARVRGVSLTRAQEELGIREAFFRWRGPGSERELFGARRYAEVFPATAGLSAAELDRRWTRRALEIFREHPLGTARMLAQGTAMLLLSPPPVILSAKWGLLRPSEELFRLWSDQELGRFAARLRQESPRVWAAAVGAVVQLVVLYGLALAGLLLLGRRVPTAVQAVLAGTFLYLAATSAGTDALDDRFRVPLMPVTCLYAGASLAALPSRPSRDELSGAGLASIR